MGGKTSCRHCADIAWWETLFPALGVLALIAVFYFNLVQQSGPLAAPTLAAAWCVLGLTMMRLRRVAPSAPPAVRLHANANLGKIIQSAILIDEDATTDAYFETVGHVERRNESKVTVHLLAN